MKDVKRVADDIVEARAALNGFYRLKPARPVPGQPVSAKELAALDAYVSSQRLPVPHAYRAFLSVYNGIKGIDTRLDLLSAKAVTTAADPALRSDFPSLSKFVIARGNTPAFISFDSETTTPSGEMEVVWVAEDGAQDRYPTFEAFLRAYRDVLKGHVAREEADRQNLSD